MSVKTPLSRDTTDYAAMMRRMIRAYGRRVAAGDPEDLAGLAGLCELVEETLAAAVAEQRAMFSWGDIGRALGVSRQAAQQRWGKP
jgi:hypothetical protein